MIDAQGTKEICNYAYRIGKIQGILNGYDRWKISAEDTIKRVAEVLNEKPADYCEIGMSHCYCCGWSGDYPVSGCPNCNNSFVS